MTERRLSEAGRVLSKRGASKGGRARFAKLTPDERTAIARKAAQARWARRDSERINEGEEA